MKSTQQVLDNIEKKLGISDEKSRQDEYFRSQYCKLYSDALHGNPEAASILGDMARLGVGVETDFKEAVKYIKMAAEQGNESAKEALEEILSVLEINT